MGKGLPLSPGHAEVIREYFTVVEHQGLGEGLFRKDTYLCGIIRCHGSSHRPGHKDRRYGVLARIPVGS